MAHFAARIANEFVLRGLNDSVTVDPLKVQKLVYFAHGWHLAFLSQPFILEDVEAWKYGPVVPELYRDFKKFGSVPRCHSHGDRECPSQRRLAEVRQDQRSGIVGYASRTGICMGSD